MSLIFAYGKEGCLTGRDPEAEITPVEPDTAGTTVGTFPVQGSSAACRGQLADPARF